MISQLSVSLNVCLQVRKVIWHIFTLVALEWSIHPLCGNFLFRFFNLPSSLHHADDLGGRDEVGGGEAVPVLLMLEAGGVKVSADDMKVHLSHGGHCMVAYLEGFSNMFLSQQLSFFMKAFQKRQMFLNTRSASLASERAAS